MNILFAGDSWTYGEELKEKEIYRFSRLVCNELNSTEFNISNNGISNDDIFERTTLFLNRNKNINFVVVQLTYLRRISIPNSNESVKKYRTLAPGSFNTFDKSVMLHYLGKSDKNIAWYDLTKYKLILFHNYLNVLNIDHMFMFIKNSDFSNLVMEDEEICSSLKSKCVTNGIYDICVKENLPIGKGSHALEQGHEYIAEKIILPRIRSVS